MTKPDTPNLQDLYFEYVKDTEAPIIYHRWALLTALGAFLGRQFYLPSGIGNTFPNMYVMLIGNPGTRKSSAIKMSKKVLSAAGYSTFAAERTTKEKFLLDLEGVNEDEYLAASRGKSRKGDTNIHDILDNLNLGVGTGDHDGIPKEVFITADEFNEFAGTGNLDFISTLGALWDWDDATDCYRQRFKNSKSIAIYQPTISILGGNTHSSFQLAFPAAALGQGFISRLILVHSEPSGRKITFPKKPDEKLTVQMMEQFNYIKQTVKGAATLEPRALRALDTIYRTWQDLEDYRLKPYSTRRFTHLQKLCLICTAMRASTIISEGDVLLANTILTFTEASMSKALSEYGNSRNAVAAHTIMSALYEAKKPLTFEDIYKLVQRDLDKRDQCQDLLRNLNEAGKLQFDKASGGFLAKQKPVNNSALFTDFKLLKEYTS